MSQEPNFYQKFSLNYGYFFSEAKLLAEHSSPYQKIVIFDSKRFGKILNIDGFNNSSEEDGYIYDEIISHIPMFAHPSPENILVIGGGDCCTNREILRHKSVKSLDMVEIDKAVIELHKKYIGTGLYEHPKLSIHIGDGAEFIRETNKVFDVIIADTTDSPPEDSAVSASFVLFTNDFFKKCFEKLSDDGIFIIQSDGWGKDYRYVSKNTLLKLKKFFKKTYLCLACIPSMYPGFMTFIAASKKYDPRIPLRRPDFETKYYSPGIHRAAFVLPPEIKNFLTDK